MHRKGVIPHTKERERLESLHNLQILETPVEQRFELITGLLCTIFDVPVSAISLVDLHRQWFKSIHGHQVDQTDRCVSFCQHTILGNDVMVIPDARFDDRFGNNPFVTGNPGIVFYAGTPIFSPEGLPIASLCIIGYEPKSLDERDRAILKMFARLVEQMLQAPRANKTEESMIRQVCEQWRSSMIDPLTRQWNAEGIQTLIRESIVEAQSNRERVGLSLIRLEGIDAIRQDQGAIACEQAIHHFSRELLASLPAHDIIGRLRGNEFACLHTNLRDKQHLLERINIIREAARRSAQKTRANKIEASIASVLTHPRGTTSAPVLMERVEDLLAGIKSDPDQARVVMESFNEDGTIQHAA